MLTFIGLGLFDESDVSVRGMDAIRSADTVFLEVYTSVLTGASIERLEACYGKRSRLFIGRTWRSMQIRSSMPPSPGTRFF